MAMAMDITTTTASTANSAASASTASPKVMVVFHCVIGGTLIWNKLCPRSPIFFPPPDESAVVSKGPVKEKKFPYLIESAAKAVLGGMAKHQMKLEEYHAKLIKVMG